jgi:prepilin-type N-terminal cleavage/methylation domain-containing protein
MTAIRRTISPCGFTLVELMIGMLVTSLVVGATAALMSAVAQGWTQSESVGNSSNRVAMTHIRLQRILRSARQLGAYRTGSIEGTSSASVLIWKGDANLDGKIQFSEIALLEFDPSDGKLRYYEVNYPGEWTEAQKAAADTPDMDDDEIYDRDAQPDPIDSFKAAAYVPSPDHAMVLAQGISGAEFHKYDSSSTTRPRFEYLLNFTSSNGSTETEYGTVTSRTATTLPAGQNGG